MSTTIDLNLYPILTAGVDEAGRGPLAGPVIAAAVILDPKKSIIGLNDSKLLTEKKRTYLSQLIKENAIAWAIARAEVNEIDQINILQASLLAMQRAVLQLNPAAEFALVDGNQKPKLPCKLETVISGDRLIPAISAASILAKVARDEEMIIYDQQYPGYEFANHKGYGTARHLELLALHGPCPIHRKSFAPVQECLVEGRSVVA